MFELDREDLAALIVIFAHEEFPETPDGRRAMAAYVVLEELALEGGMLLVPEDEIDGADLRARFRIELPS